MTIRVSLRQMGYFICLYVRHRRANLWGSLDTVLFWVYRQEYFKGKDERRGVTRFRSAEKIKEEAGREWEGREALFCLGEKTRPERRARKLSVCLLETHALLASRPTTCHLVVYFRCPGPISLRSGTYEIRRPICRSFTCQNALSYWRCICDGCYVAFIPIPRSPPPPPPAPSPPRVPPTLSKGCREKGCIWHVSKVSLHTRICSRDSPYTRVITKAHV